MKRVGFFTVVFLCSLVPLVLDAAPSVRRLGGVGTFNGSNKAEEAKANTTKNIRLSSVRADGATNVGRVASNSRLSIGKYLGGASTISGSASKPSMTPDLSGVASDDDLKVVRDSVAALENFVGYSETDDTIAETVTSLDETVTSLDETVTSLDETVTSLDETVTSLDETVTSIDETVTSLDEKVSTVSDNVKNLSAEVTRIDEIDRVVGENSAGILELQERLSEIAGEQIQITYENGILTLIRPGVAPQSYDLLKGLDSQFANKADKAEVDGLNNRLDNLSDAFVGTSQDAVQTLQGQYSVSGKLYVDTPALP